jgi:hypothetical protein
MEAALKRSNLRLDVAHKYRRPHHPGRVPGSEQGDR